MKQKFVIFDTLGSNIESTVSKNRRIKSCKTLQNIVTNGKNNKERL